MPETKESLLKIINASGFLFQLRIEQEIKSTDLARIWDISAREHRWYDSQEGSDGFMDLVLTQTGSARIVIECKRVTNANWIFLIPDNKDRVLNAQIKWTMRIKPDKYFTDWQDFKVRPVSPEATFCSSWAGRKRYSDARTRFLFTLAIHRIFSSRRIYLYRPRR